MSEFRRSNQVGKSFISGETFQQKPVTYSEIEGRAIFEGDIDLGSVEQMETARQTVENQTEEPIEFGIAITDSKFRWPNAVIPFRFAANFPNPKRVTDAIAHIEANTPLRFRQRTTEANFVTFQDGGGCSSSVGMQGGEQFVTLGAGCGTGNAIHELCHTAGLWHEQSREDRNNFVTINFSNIQPDLAHNFDQQINDGDDIGAYDYASIMHYPRNAFAINPAVDTITPKPNANTPIGQRAGLSPGDIAAIKTIYPPLGAFQRFLLQTGTPISQADAAANFDFAVGNFRGDQVPDLFCLKKKSAGSGRLEVHVLSGAAGYQSFLLQTGTPVTQADAAANFAFAVGDFNRDGIVDLYCVKRSNTGSGKLEVHILNGASNYQNFLLQTPTPIAVADAANFVFAVGDFNNDGIADLFCLKRTNAASGRLEVHVLNGATNFQSFLLQTGTPIAAADAAANFAFAVGEFNRDGRQDLICLKKTNTGTGKLEAHILSGANNYQSFLLQLGCAISSADAAANFVFAAGDFNRDGVADVYALKRTNSGTGRLEVHILNGSTASADAATT